MDLLNSPVSPMRTKSFISFSILDAHWNHVKIDLKTSLGTTKTKDNRRRTRGSSDAHEFTKAVKEGGLFHTNRGQSLPGLQTG